MNELPDSVTDLGKYIKEHYPNDVELFKLFQIVNVLTTIELHKKQQGIISIHSTN